MVSMPLMSTLMRIQVVQMVRHTTIKIVSAPAGYYTDSTIIPPQTGVYDSDANEANCTLDAITNSGSCEVQGQPDAPQGNQDTTYFMDFSLSSGDSNVIFNHIPLDSQRLHVKLSLMMTRCC